MRINAPVPAFYLPLACLRACLRICLLFLAGRTYALSGVAGGARSLACMPHQRARAADARSPRARGQI